MPVRVYVSGLSGNQEMKKRQQRIETVLMSSEVKFELVDITEAGKEDDRSFMQQNAVARKDQRLPLTPQIFNGKDYCGDFQQFDEAVEAESVYEFLKLSAEEVGEAEQTRAQKRSTNRPSTPDPCALSTNASQSPTVSTPEPVAPRSTTPLSPSLPPSPPRRHSSPAPPESAVPGSNGKQDHQQPQEQSAADVEESCELKQLRQVARALVTDSGNDGDREA